MGQKVIRMEMEKQVCNIELAKKLKALGVKQESLIAWLQPTIVPDAVAWLVADKIPKIHKNNQYCSAFTVAELSEMLPNMIKLRPCKLMKFTEDRYTYLNIQKQHKTWSVTYPHPGISCMKESTLADAMAMMLICLIDNDYIGIDN